MPDLFSTLGLNVQEIDTVERRATQLDTLSEFLNGAVDKFKDAAAFDRLSDLFPWLKHGVEIAGEALPPIKAAAKAVEAFAAITDPFTLGMIAFTAAYEQACIEAISLIGKPEAAIGFLSKETGLKIKKTIKSELLSLESRDNRLFDDFSLASCETHRITKVADAAFLVASSHFGYNEMEGRRLMASVHRRLRANLKTVLVSGKERFKSFRELLQLNEDDGNIRALVHENAERQVHAFFNSPVLQVEPFALADVYLDCECGILRWQQIQERVDPFLDSPLSGGRQDLLNAVLAKIGQKAFHDVIVVQAPPGAGKSAFTLRLCAQLMTEGLCPVRVRMRDLPLEKSLLEAIGFGLEVVEGVRLDNASGVNGAQLSRLFSEKVRFGDAEICPYIFILDAWDEISRSLREGDGFQVRVDRFMSEVRTIFGNKSLDSHII